MTGLSGFEGFVKPVGMPVFFEDPFITNDLNLLYVDHKVSAKSYLLQHAVARGSESAPATRFTHAMSGDNSSIRVG